MKEKEKIDDNQLIMLIDENEEKKIKKLNLDANNKIQILEHCLFRDRMNIFKYLEKQYCNDQIYENIMILLAKYGKVDEVNKKLKNKYSPICDKLLDVSLEFKNGAMVEYLLNNFIDQFDFKINEIFLFCLEKENNELLKLFFDNFGFDNNNIWNTSLKINLNQTKFLFLFFENYKSPSLLKNFLEYFVLNSLDNFEKIKVVASSKFGYKYFLNDSIFSKCIEKNYECLILFLTTYNHSYYDKVINYAIKTRNTNILLYCRNFFNWKFENLSFEDCDFLLNFYKNNKNKYFYSNMFKYLVDNHYFDLVIKIKKVYNYFDRVNYNSIFVKKIVEYYKNINSKSILGKIASYIVKNNDLQLLKDLDSHIQNKKDIILTIDKNTNDEIIELIMEEYTINYCMQDIFQRKNEKIIEFFINVDTQVFSKLNDGVNIKKLLSQLIKENYNVFLKVLINKKLLNSDNENFLFEIACLFKNYEVLQVFFVNKKNNNYCFDIKVLDFLVKINDDKTLKLIADNYDLSDYLMINYVKIEQSSENIKDIFGLSSYEKIYKINEKSCMISLEDFEINDKIKKCKNGHVYSLHTWEKYETIKKTNKCCFCFENMDDKIYKICSLD